jgi:flagellar motor protein MotB
MFPTQLRTGRALAHLRLIGGLLLLCLPFGAGCASQAALQEYETEITRLREDKTQLQRDNQRLQGELTRYEAELVSARQEAANSKAVPAQGFQNLTDLGIDVEARGNSVAISIPSSITFASGSADLSSGGKAALREVAKVLKTQYPKMNYWIEGHTDTDQPSKSKFKSNRELSVARALSVLTHLVVDEGLPDEQCVIAGHGEYANKAPNDSSGNKAKNRRVEVIVYPPDAR